MPSLLTVNLMSKYGVFFILPSDYLAQWPLWALGIM